MRSISSVAELLAGPESHKNGSFQEYGVHRLQPHCARRSAVLRTCRPKLGRAAAPTVSVATIIDFPGKTDAMDVDDNSARARPFLWGPDMRSAGMIENGWGQKSNGM